MVKRFLKAIIFPLLSIGTTSYGVFYLDHIGVDKADILLAGGFGIFTTFILIDWSIKEFGGKSKE